MPSPMSAYDLVKKSMQIIGALDPGETPTAEEANDGLVWLNDVLEQWSIQHLSVYGSANDTFNTVGGQAMYTIGPGANWVTDRPVHIGDVGYAVLNGASFRIDQISQSEYNLLAVKATPGIPERFLYINDAPLGLITLWPVPNQVMPVTLSIDRVLAAVPSLATVMTLPPGYFIALRYDLAMAMAADYGRIMPPDHQRFGMKAKADLMRSNVTRRPARFDAALLPGYVTWQKG